MQALLFLIQLIDKNFDKTTKYLIDKLKPFFPRETDTTSKSMTKKMENTKSIVKSFEIKNLAEANQRQIHYLVQERERLSTKVEEQDRKTVEQEK